MEAQFKTKSGQLMIKVDGQTFKDVIQRISEAQEILRNDQCGCCKSVNTRVNYRKSGDYDFYEILCEDCGAALGLGVRAADGKLFPRRRDERGDALPNGGWKKWESKKGGGNDGDPF